MKKAEVKKSMNLSPQKLDAPVIASPERFRDVAISSIKIRLLRFTRNDNPLGIM